MSITLVSKNHVSTNANAYSGLVTVGDLLLYTYNPGGVGSAQAITVTDSYMGGSTGWAFPANNNVFNSSSGTNIIQGYKIATNASALIAATITASNPSIAATNSFTAGEGVAFNGSFAGVTGLAVNTTYYVSATGLSGSAFQVSATSGGGVITPGGSSTATPNVFACLTTTYAGGVANKDNTVFSFTGFVGTATYISMDNSSGSSPSSTTVNSGSFNTSQAQELVVGLISSSSAPGSISGWTQVSVSTGQLIPYFQIFPTVATAADLSAAITPATAWNALIQGFYDGGTGGSQQSMLLGVF